METKFGILIVDDDEDLASNLSDILSSEGYGTSVACDGKTAVALCRKKTFDLAIVDIKLPDVSGLELIRELAKLSPVTEYIIITGHASLETAAEAVSEQKVVAYETKPVDIERLITLIKQVVERKQAEEELQKSENRYRATFEHTGTAMILIEEDTTVSVVNKQVLTLFGYPREEIEGKRKWTEFVHPEDLARMMEYHRLRRKEGGEAPKQYEARLFNRAGDILDMIVSVDIIPGTKQSIVSLLDITGPKKAQQALEENEARYRELADSLPQIVFETDAKGSLTFVNRAAFSVMGYTPEEVAGGLCVLDMVVPHDRERVAEDIQRVFNGEKLGGQEYLMQRKDGTSFPVRIYSSSIIRGSEVMGLRGFIIDVTEQKKAAEERRGLEKRVQMANRLASIGEMASGIAHEINNPLTSVIGYSQLLLERDIPEDIGEDVGIIADGAQRVADVVKRLLTFSRQYEPVKSSNDINQIIEVVLKLRGYELETGNIEVITRLDPELPWVLCDAGQLQQVFINITINADASTMKEVMAGIIAAKENVDMNWKK